MNHNRATALVFIAAMAVYSNQANPLNQANAASLDPSSKSATTEVRVLDQATDAPTTIPAFPTAQPLATGQVAVSKAGTVEIHVSDASLQEVLRMLSLQSQRNIIASKDVRGTITANLYDVTVKEALDAILKANGYDYRERGNFLYVYSAKEMAELERAERKTVTQVIRLSYINAADAQKLISPALSKDAVIAMTPQAANGIQAGGANAGGDSFATNDLIVITDYAENLEMVRKMLLEVDHKPQQVLIEATILQAGLNENNSLGVDFSVLGGVDFTSLNGPGSPAANGFNNAAGAGVLDSQANAQVAQNGYVAGRIGGGGLKLGVVKNNIGVFINALEGITDTTVLANPKILVLNKQRGEVHVGADLGYRDTTTIGTNGSTVGQVSFLQTGTRLIFRPFIGADGYIRMEVHPEESHGVVKADGTPDKFTTEVTSNLIIKDGNTIVIGGLFREENTTTRNQTPFLGNLPLLGSLFRNQTDKTQRDEIIILLTPHVIKDDNAYAAASATDLKNLEQMRAGVRKGMLPWGRERMAEAEYQQAIEQMNSPAADRKKALWHLECAINLNPKFIEAMNLRQKLSGQEVTAVDNSTMRSFVTRLMLSDPAIAMADAPHVVTISPLPATQPNAEPTRVPLAPMPSEPPAPTPVPTPLPTPAPMRPLAPATAPHAAAFEQPSWARPLVSAAPVQPAAPPAAKVKIVVTELPGDRP